jgi:hypothetical protein
MSFPAGLFLIYAMGVTLSLFILARKCHSPSGRDLESLKLEELSPLQRLEALARIAEIRKSEISWYERSISTLGVIAFFSMLLATTAQTIKAGLDEIRAERLKQELHQLEEQKSELVSVVAQVSKAVLQEYQRSGSLDQGGKQLLASRLRTLVTLEPKTRNQALEQFDLALVLREFAAATEVLDEHSDLIDEQNPTDRITMAEYFLISGDEDSARSEIARVKPDLSRLGAPPRLRAIFVMAALDPSNSALVREVADLLHINEPRARERVEAEIDNFREAARQYRKPARGER